MTYSVKELFYTLQGEGARTGRAAVFCRFSGCNLWSGMEKDRENAQCNFCDTDFVDTDGPGGEKFKSADDLAGAAAKLWPNNKISDAIPYIVCTGGEPLLQLDVELIKTFQKAGFEVAVETNGTIEAPPELDWICVSPKVSHMLLQQTGNELKLVYPQDNVQPEDVEHLNFDHFFLQPLDQKGKDYTLGVAEYCQKNPKWRLSLQTHKIIGIP